VLLAFGAFFYMRSGHYWLTSKRVIWQPRMGEPVQVLLSSLSESQLAVSRFGSVTVGGITLRHVPHASRLAALLSLRRRKEFRDAAATKDPQRISAIVDMYLTAPGQVPDMESAQSGLVVLRPGFVVYIPNTYIPGSGFQGAQILDFITEPMAPSRHPARHSRDRVSVPIGMILEQLQFLPEDQMDALLRKAATFDSNAFVWERQELKSNFGGSSRLELSCGGKAVSGSLPSWREHQAVQQVIHHWSENPEVPGAHGAQGPTG
jgi:hypothetical protein